MERTCKKCGKTKIIEEFVKDKKSLYGYRHECKKCYAQLNLKRCRKWRDAHKEQAKQNNKIWRMNHPDKVAQYRRNREGKVGREYLKRVSKEYYHRSIKNKEYKEKLQLRSKKVSAEKRKEYNNKRMHSDAYVLQNISLSSRVPISVIREYPELIELKRIQLRLLTLIK